MSKAKKDNNAMAIVDERPDWLPDTAEGTENIANEDLILPRLEVAQAISDCVKTKNPNYIEGIEVGDLYNSLTREIYGPEVVLVPVHFQKNYLIWKDRKAGGGFRGAYASAEEADREIEKMVDAGDERREDLEITPTPEHFALIVREGHDPEQIVVPMARTKSAASRAWNSLKKMGVGPTYGRAYKISAVEDSSPKGDFINLHVSSLGYVSKDVFDSAKAAYDAIQSGAIKVDRNYEEPEAGEEEEEF